MALRDVMVKLNVGLFNEILVPSTAVEVHLGIIPPVYIEMPWGAQLLAHYNNLTPPFEPMGEDYIKVRDLPPGLRWNHHFNKFEFKETSYDLHET